ncbi:MAG: hypothetical protein GY820_02755 [Gammaproteobacteria bacterium]|nr:hypothetical protein [Gammaproteobacteria bacterium]
MAMQLEDSVLFPKVSPPPPTENSIRRDQKLIFQMAPFTPWRIRILAESTTEPAALFPFNGAIVSWTCINKVSIDASRRDDSEHVQIE